MDDIKNLATVYDALEVEKKIYGLWEEKGQFHADSGSEKPAYSIVIPPPNVTGVLHMGHALDGTLQDILTRYYRMSGFEALWLPGCDHAGIATQNVVERHLEQMGKTRAGLGREEFLKVTWDWAEEHKKRILGQFKRLGASFDLSRERFTLDEGCSLAVKKVFVDLYNKGLIYKGTYIVNWCPRCESAISDIETNYEAQSGKLWEISYPLKDAMGAIVVATTRPETMFGDVAVAVNPTDYKYKDLIGKTCILPLTGREIPIIGDCAVDKSFGTGALKITPAHDPNDFEIGKRHNLVPIKVIDEAGKMIAKEEVHPELHGRDRYDARERTIRMLTDHEVLVRVREHEHNVGCCQRCSTVIEPLLSDQWFVKMGPLAKVAVEKVKDGSIKFVPERWEKNYLMWMENIRDWCISRQLWWGHRIPAFYHKETGDMVVAMENPDPQNYTQDNDVLDTWFSSGLWPFSTMGWPDTEAADFKKFYPTSTLVTGFDIIFFWVARMITLGLEFTGEPPFSTVYIHGLITDESGQKMSKSKGNTIDPVETIDKYGCDALRFTLTSLCTYGGQNIKLADERFEYGRNFANKVWNASRFVLQNLENPSSVAPLDLSKLSLSDKWILNELNELAQGVNENIKNYRFAEAAGLVYEFFWNSYCDWYLELSKVEKNESVLTYVLDKTLRLLHPIMPHITEQIWQFLPIEKDSEFIMKSEFPTHKNELHFKEASQMGLVFEAIRALRNMRASFGISVSSKINAQIACDSAARELFKSAEHYIKRLAKVEEISFVNEDELTLNQSAACTVGTSKIVVPLFGLIDINKEIERQKKKIEKLENERKSLLARLNNEKFVSSAPSELVKATKARIEELAQEIGSINELVKRLS
ncbi:valyl-tRNA synthetase [Candidatus Gastranaerophilus sp. (ex Termes propinquus)]|nr:valyl-tRNA synthetase [Candidatus Gastranaerophilus sp. (ex Termes propinquus)]